MLHLELERALFNSDELYSRNRSSQYSVHYENADEKNLREIIEEPINNSYQSKMTAQSNLDDYFKDFLQQEKNTHNKINDERIKPALDAFGAIFSQENLGDEEKMIGSCIHFVQKCFDSELYSEAEAVLVAAKLRDPSVREKFVSLKTAISSTNDHNSGNSDVVKKALNEFVRVLFPYDGVAEKDAYKRNAFLSKNKVFLEQMKLKAKDIGERYREVNSNNNNTSQPNVSNSSINPKQENEFSQWVIKMINAENDFDFKNARSSLLSLVDNQQTLSVQEYENLSSKWQWKQVRSLLKKGNVEELVSLFTPDTKDMPIKVREQIIQTVSEHKSNAQKNDSSADPFTNSQSSSKKNVNGSFVITPQVSSPIFPQVDETHSNTTASSSAATNLAQPSATDFKGKVINLVVNFITSNDGVETLTSTLENLKNGVTATNAKPTENVILLDFGDEESSDSQKTLSESDEKLYQSILENQERIQNIRSVVNRFGLTKPEVIKNAKEIAALLFYPKDTSATTSLQAGALEDQWLESQEGKDIYNQFSVSIDAHIQPQNPGLNESPNYHASNIKSATFSPLHLPEFDNGQDDEHVNNNLSNEVHLNNNNVQSAHNSSSSNQQQDIKQRLSSLCQAETNKSPLFQHFSTLLSHNEQCSLNEREFIESKIPFKSVNPLLNSNSTVSSVFPKFPSDLLQGNATLLAKAYPTAAGNAPLSQVAVKLVAVKGGVSNITEKDQYAKLDGASKYQVAMELAILYMNKCYRPGQTITIDKGSNEEKLIVYAAVNALIKVKHELDKHNLGTINVVSEEGTVEDQAKEDAVTGFYTWLGQQGGKYTAYLEQLSQPKQTTADKLKSFLFKAKAPVQPTQNQSVEIIAKPGRFWK